ncbi:MAG TPA: hypothetical protein ENK57_09200 [Polyangiaceae bacterium]|nr:hypothetical protein [Polyangiaceae bacterium]
MQLIVAQKQTVRPSQINLTFWPAEADLDAIGARTVDPIEPQHWDASVITAPQPGCHLRLEGVCADAA